MASETRNKKIRDLYNPVTNPSGGLAASAAPFKSLFGGLVYRGEKPKDPLEGGMSMMPAGYDPRADQAPAPVATPDSGSGSRAAALGGRAPAPASYNGVPIRPGSDADVAAQLRAIDGRGQGAAPETPGAQPPAGAAAAPRQWLKPDGSFKTPDEVAADVASTLRGVATGGDVGRLAREDFGGGQKSAAELEADARRAGNVRNDIAVGEADPYKVASKSGIAYSPAELAAIESAYAGIYDPALDSALAKVKAKQAEDAAAAQAAAKRDEMLLQADIDASKPFSLGKNEVRYDGQGNVIAVGFGDTPAGGGAYVVGQDPTVDAFIQGIRSGTYKASDVPDEYKAQVAQGMAATKPSISKSSLQAVSVIDELLADPGLDAIAGVPGVSAFFPGTEAQNTKTLARQLQGILALENRDQLKGSGAISDFEFKVLEQAASALGIDSKSGRSSLSNEDFRFQLDKLKLKLQVGETELADDELLYLRDQGYTPEEIRALGSPQPSFSAAGNASASTGTGNRPQRNYNPGNVKAGGLADALAVGTDDQGHLIFPDEETGFKAMTLDLTAKINGQSQWLPANPTIRQLGAVYAEDPNWPKKVAQILGVTPDTQTGSISIPTLARAIATQEGYYA